MVDWSTQYCQKMNWHFNSVVRYLPWLLLSSNMSILYSMIFNASLKHHHLCILFKVDLIKKMATFQHLPTASPSNVLERLLFVPWYKYMFPINFTIYHKETSLRVVLNCSHTFCISSMLGVNSKIWHLNNPVWEIFLYFFTLEISQVRWFSQIPKKLLPWCYLMLNEWFPTWW